MTMQKPNYPTDISFLDKQEPSPSKKKGSHQNGHEDKESPSRLHKKGGRDPVSLPSPSTAQIKYYKQLSLSKSFDDFSNRVAKFISNLGFTQYEVSRVSASGNCPLPIISKPHEMREIYFEQKMYQHDLVPQIIMHNNSPFFQSLIEEHVNEAPFITDAITQNRENFKLMKSYGFVDFYYIPLGTITGHDRVMLAVATDHDDLVEFRAHVDDCKGLLSSLVEAIDYTGSRKFPEYFLSTEEDKDIKITPKPIKVLNALASDLTLVQVADQLGISINTADKHIAVAKKALGAHTIHGAIYTAIKEGIVKLELE